MKRFLTVILESEGKIAKHTFFHPIRGMYKVHQEGDMHHVKNDEGEETHTFVGKTDNEVIDILKTHHDLIYAGKLHEGMITELRKPKEVLSDEEQARKAAAKKASAGINIHRGSYNEARVAYHLNGNKWIDAEHKQMADHHKSMLAAHDKKYGTNEVKTQEARAPEQAKSFLEHAKQRGYEQVEKVHLTAKPGDIERHTGIKATQQENPSDLVAKFKKKPESAAHHYFGNSLKSSGAKAIGFHNGGTKEIGNLIGHDLLGHAEKRHQEFMKKNGLGTNTSAAAKAVAGEKKDAAGNDNPEYRNNELYHKASEHARKVNTEIRDKLHEGYSQMSQKDLKNHLLKTYIKGNTAHALPYVKTHGTGGDGKKPAAAHTEDPSDNDMYHKIKKAKKIELHKAGEGQINVHADGHRVFGLQVKHNNGPLTNMKIGAQP